MWQRRGMPEARGNSNLRLLLCRPQGGLNDLLSEIGKCIVYAQRHNRTVIVETDYHALDHFNDSFGNYFVSTDANLALDSAPFVDVLDQLPTQPVFIAGRVTTYTCAQHRGGIDQLTGQAVTFDFTRDHAEPLLVHHAVASNKKRNALVALGKMRLADPLMADLRLRLGQLGDIYTAVHVRHTDYQTDYEKRVLRLKPKIIGKVFVATDNLDVVAFCRREFGNDRMFSFAQLPEDAGKPLHHTRGVEGARKRNTDSILDLFTLAMAKQYYYFPRITGRFQFWPRYSGFSVLADRLRKEPKILRHVLEKQIDGIS
jgi:hypothetical protein